MGTRYHIILLFLLIPGILFSSDQIYKRNLSWKGIQHIKLSETESIPLIRFDGSVNDYESNFLPVFYDRFQLSVSPSEIDVNLLNKVFEPVPDNEVYVIEGFNEIGNKIHINTGIGFERKLPFATISFVPIRKNELTQSYERLISFEIQVIPVGDDHQGNNYKSTSYKQSSVLAQGNWRKVSVSKTGVYKITYEEFKDMGIDIDNINPQNIRIYGNGGGMLPESPSVPRYDDLQENAIFVYGEEDETFNSGDYVLFYGMSPNILEYRSADKRLHKSMHLYSDYNFYFITTDLGAGKRIQTQQSPSLDPTFTSNKFNDGYHHELEDKNLIGTGRVWFGETFDLNTTIIENISFPYLDKNYKVYLAADVAAKSDISSSFSFDVNNQNVLNISIPPTNSSNINSDYAKAKFDSTSFIVNSSDLTLKIVYNKPLNSSTGWLNYFTLNVVRDLSFVPGQMTFQDLRTDNQVYITQYTLSKVTSNVRIWDISDPINVSMVSTSSGNNQLTFKVESNGLNEFLAFDGSSYYSVFDEGQVSNQDLHGLGTYEMIILTHPNFTSEAVRLADFHIDHDNINTVVVELQDVYNEFSTGMQDITALRDFAKMLYDRAHAGEEPKYLLLFGDGSYDNKNRVEGNTNYVPTWQSYSSLNPVGSYVKDDFYALYDDDNLVDIGVGRFVVSSESQAKSAVDKVIHYATNTDVVMNEWRNIICLIADDEDQNLHFRDAETLAYQIDTSNHNINIDKIYLDAYEQVSTPSGERYPQVTQDITNRVERGALLMNYVGHGGELGLAHERILKIADINSWDNLDNMPVFMTATCEFSRFDDPSRTSAGEYVFLNPKGAGISLFTTTRATYAGANLVINKNFMKYMLTKVDGEHYRMGDVIRLAKNQTGSIENRNKFVLLGDPALAFAWPEENVITNKINNVSVQDLTDTVKALSEITIEGELQDIDGNKLSSFNGTLFPIVFDKPSQYTTLGNDPASTPANFYIQKNPLYKGQASIKNGDWNFTFITPKDIAYQYGYGKLSYYAKNDNEDAAGYFLDVVVGGYNENAAIDLEGPMVNLFMCDTLFKSGGITDENPDLLAYIEDESGINTVGSGIGHNIVATLDDSEEFILNDYYEADLNNYRQGKINYPFFNLESGYHVLTLKVWDIHNNSTTTSIDFVINGDTKANNYPNPFSTSTSFIFEHTYCDEPIDVIIQIYSLTGQLVNTINDKFNSGCYVYKSEEWDGTNQNGSRLDGGMYIYRIFANSTEGETLYSLSGKMVLID